MQGKLKVTKDGRAFNLTTGKELAKQKASGYRKLSWLCQKTRKIVQIQLHRLVWIVYKGYTDDPYAQVNHKDGNKSNCRLSNLELTDSSGNVRHALKTGLTYVLVGDDKPNAIWSDSQVTKYRRLVINGSVTVSQVAKKFNCARATASAMLKGKTYAHVGR